MAALSVRGREPVLLSAAKADLPAGVVAESYSHLNILDSGLLVRAIESCLEQVPARERWRAGVCLPDGIFRVQTLDLDELPGKRADRERLIRWRLDKTAAFDVSDTLLRYQILDRREGGFTILACVAKKAVIEQYESALSSLAIEPWTMGVSSFMTLNFFAPRKAKNAACALICVARDSFATIVSENGGARFYRYKDVKRGNADEIRTRLVREIEDSLHFYTHHLDRSQQTEVRRLHLSGEPAVLDALAPELTVDSREVEVLLPESVLGAAAGAGAEMAAALGAATTL